MLRSSVLAELLVLIIIVTYAYVIPSSILSFAQNSGDISDNNSLRGSLLMVQEGVAYSSTPEEAHSMKLEIMTEYFLDSDNDEILVDNGLTLGHLSLDEIEGAYFLKFSMLKILKISKDFTTIVFHGSAWQNSDNAKRISSTDAWVTVSGRITYNEPINLRDKSVTTMISEKSNIQINIRDNSGQLMKLSSKGSMNGRVSTNILPSPSEIQGKSFILETANGDKFKVYATDPEAIQLLIDNYYGLNNMFVMGRLVIGDGSFNSPWSWHLDPDHVTMAEFAIELCDGTPSEVEHNLPYWLFQVETFCPWSSKVIEIGP
ncbi:MAG: hypothetical protein K0S84_917 [Nitrososphaera sp.]|jgi:hypothetical protein|nr:hypothetical protein [Nitrososphaera sp.]